MSDAAPAATPGVIPTVYAQRLVAYVDILGWSNLVGTAEDDATIRSLAIGQGVLERIAHIANDTPNTSILFAQVSDCLVLSTPASDRYSVQLLMQGVQAIIGDLTLLCQKRSLAEGSTELGE